LAKLSQKWELGQSFSQSYPQKIAARVTLLGHNLSADLSPYGVTLVFYHTSCWMADMAFDCLLNTGLGGRH
jgi:hypothetical protein